MSSIVRLVVLLSFVAVCWAQQLVRPKDEVTEVTPVEIRSCPQDEWDSIKGIRGYNNWTAETLADVEGFTVMLTQSATTVSSRCYGTQITKQNGSKIAFMNIFPTQSSNSMVFNLGEMEDTNKTAEEEVSKQLMVAGASPNFVAYATCNNNSSHVNIFVTYKNTITDVEKKAINKWIKSSNLPMLGRWAAINFDTCSFTKTYVCDGGREAFCSRIHRRSKAKADSSEESDEDNVEELIFVPW